MIAARRERSRGALPENVRLPAWNIGLQVAFMLQWLGLGKPRPTWKLPQEGECVEDEWSLEGKLAW
jgi:hypothetical protein